MKKLVFFIAAVFAVSFLFDATCAFAQKKDDVVVIGGESTPEVKKEEPKPAEAKKEEKKEEKVVIGGEATAETKKADETKPVEIKKDEPKKEEAKPADVKKEEPAAETKKEEKKEEPKPAEQPKAEADDLPAAPADLTGKFMPPADGMKQHVLLNWSKAPGAYRYLIYKSSEKEPKPEDGIEPMSTTDNSFEDEDVAAGKTYYYCVATQTRDKANPKTKKQSAYSKAVSVETADRTPPAIPADFSAAANGDKVELKWKSCEEGDFAGYVIRRGTEKGSLSEIKKISDRSASSFIDESCEGAKEYFYSISAADKNGNESKQSEVKSAKTEDLAPPEAPAGLKAETAENGKVKFVWDELKSKNLDSYIVLKSESRDDSGFSEIKKVGGAAFEEDGLSDGKTYYYRIVAAGRNGLKSKPSDVLSVQIRDTLAPGAPKDLVASASGLTVKLAWSKSDAADLKGYVVYRGESESKMERLAESESCEAKDSTTKSGIEYHYCVSAVDAAGNESEKSTAIKIKVKNPVVINFGKFSEASYYGFAYNPESQSLYYAESKDAKSWKWWSLVHESIPMPEDIGKCSISFARDGSRICAFIYDIDKTAIMISTSGDGGKSWKWWKEYSSSMPLPDNYDEGAVLNFSVKGDQVTCTCYNPAKKNLAAASTTNGKAWKWWETVGDNLGELPNASDKAQYSSARMANGYEVYSYNLGDLTLYRGDITEKGRGFSSWLELSSKFPKPPNLEK